MASPGASDTLRGMMVDAYASTVEDQAALHARLRSEIRTLAMAGNLTVATALTWTWYLLAQHPAVEAALHAELDHVLACRPPTLADIPALRFTRQIFAETLRLYPPIWNLSRRVATECEIGGFPVRAGALLLFSPYLIHHDARYYDKPERFDPNRWEEEAERTRPKLAYLPFGAGPRGCMGESFAWMEGILVIAALAQRWRITRLPGPAIAPRPATTLRPKEPIPMVVRARTLDY